ncbi:complement factor I-like isoform X5 [Syngnathoides biaculeatus]|uniref:complement factor I-like isoform X5 n=1 Tax=Syngnathoides biaculeatus TaxID=300417 RepID=UPI002ADDE7AA|nr:complement factor I-like isoform X5 [Syngnathoides biaculeatus]
MHRGTLLLQAAVFVPRRGLGSRLREGRLPLQFLLPGHGDVMPLPEVDHVPLRRNLLRPATQVQHHPGSRHGRAHPLRSGRRESRRREAPAGVRRAVEHGERQRGLQGSPSPSVSGKHTTQFPSSERDGYCSRTTAKAVSRASCQPPHPRSGAASAGLLEATALRRGFPDSCVSLRCQGFETSPAECVIHDAVRVGDGKVATATCYRESDATEERGFACASGKRVPADRTCDGTDDCGDQSDEMCCKRCRGGAFRCDTGVCLHPDAEGDGQIDCLAGEDEAATRKAAGTESKSTEYVSPRKEILTDRLHLESRLRCGVPNATAAYDDSVKDRARRFRRVVGGVAANRTQIQWQVGLSENGKVNCGGTYIGGCWIVTAAHCVRPHPSAYRVKFSIWEKSRPQDTTDIIPVGEVIIHPGFDSRTYENDIALVRLKDLPEQWGKCMEDNPAVKPACVPWSERLFNANHTCSISGWGRTAVGKASQVLLWAKVSLIDDCRRFYKDRFKPGMMCAGDLEGAVDSCQGDSGGPLVCEDHLGVSYLWGIVSWGDQCGQPGFPGVYTQVAHYFEWIRLHTGWSAVTRFNS